MDYRSFRLNFEVNAFFYDAALGEELRDIYLADVASRRCSTAPSFGRPHLAVPEGISRLVSPCSLPIDPASRQSCLYATVTSAGHAAQR